MQKVTVAISFLVGIANAVVIHRRALDTAEDYYMDLAKGQRDILGMFDKLFDKEGKFWTSFSGGVTIGGMIGLGCVGIGVIMMCCWISKQWDDVLGIITRMLRRAPVTAPTLNNTVHVTAAMDPPPTYEMTIISEQTTEYHE